VKAVNLNQLLFHSNSSPTLSFFQPHKSDAGELSIFLEDMQLQLSLRGKAALAAILEMQKNNVMTILKNHPEKSHGFFISEELQGHVALDSFVEPFCIIGNSFHVRPLLSELFVNPEYLVVNISLYDIQVYKGDFNHLEVIKQYDFETLAIDMKARLFTPKHVGLIPYKSILALKNIAQDVMEMTHYDSLPVIVTGLDEMKEIFLKNFNQSLGVISHIQDDFYEKTCVEILQKCKHYRYSVIDFYAAKFKERLKKTMKSKRLISDLKEIIEAVRAGRVVNLVIPTEKKVYGRINLETGQFVIHKRKQIKNPSVDILNELAEEVIGQGGKIQVLAPHFFPEDTFVLAILKG
jgi:hypothetical protein